MALQNEQLTNPSRAPKPFLVIFEQGRGEGLSLELSERPVQPGNEGDPEWMEEEASGKMMLGTFFFKIYSNAYALQNSNNLTACR